MGRTGQQLVGWAAHGRDIRGKGWQQATNVAVLQGRARQHAVAGASLCLTSRPETSRWQQGRACHRPARDWPGPPRHRTARRGSSGRRHGWRDRQCPALQRRGGQPGGQGAVGGESKQMMARLLMPGPGLTHRLDSGRNKCNTALCTTEQAARPGGGRVGGHPGRACGWHTGGASSRGRSPVPSTRTMRMSFRVW